MHFYQGIRLLDSPLGHRFGIGHIQGRENLEVAFFSHWNPQIFHASIAGGHIDPAIAAAICGEYKLVGRAGTAFVAQNRLAVGQQNADGGPLEGLVVAIGDEALAVFDFGGRVREAEGSSQKGQRDSGGDHPFSLFFHDWHS